MTATGSASSAGRSRRTALWIAAAVLGAVLIAVLTRTSPAGEGALDPTSPRPNGTKAAMELARSFGATVDLPESFPPRNADVAIMFVDVVPSDREQDVRDWVAEGHTLVVADPSSSLTPEAEPAASGGPGANPSNPGVDPGMIERGRCTIDALSGVRSLQTDEVFHFRYRVPEGSAGCFEDDGLAFAVLTPVGRGQIVALGGPDPFTNANLGELDDAVLATALLAPNPGTRVAVLQAKTFPGGEPEPTDLSGALDRLLSNGPSLVILELVIAFFVLGIAWGRRVGRPVLEPQPVQIAGSELVDAVGGLLRRTKDPSSAAAVLRADVRRDLCERLGLPRDAPPELIADTLAARTGFDRTLSLAVLAERDIPDDDTFLQFTRQLESLRKEVFHEHAP